MANRPQDPRPPERGGGLDVAHLVWCVAVVVAVFVLNLSGVVLFSDSEARSAKARLADIKFLFCSIPEQGVNAGPDGGLQGREQPAPIHV